MGTPAEAVAVEDELEQSTRKESAHHSAVDHQHHDEDLSAKDETALTVNERRKKNLSVFVTEPGIFSTLDLFISHVYMPILGRLGSGAFAFAFAIVQLPQLSLHIIYSFREIQYWNRAFTRMEILYVDTFLIISLSICRVWTGVNVLLGG